MEICASCGASLSRDEIAVTKKLINRGATAFFCISCLAKHFDVTPQDIQDRIAYFREMGCTLFDSSNFDCQEQ